MSHFTVLVVGENAEAQLAPFEENLKVEFEDEEDELREEYATESSEMIVLSSGERVCAFDNRFKKSELFAKGGQYAYPEGSEKVKVPHRERYATFEEFVSGWHGKASRDAEHGKFGSYSNPRAKWDWYCLGGRWTGYWTLKPWRNGVLASCGKSPSGFHDEERAPVGTADSAKKGNIDFDAMRDEAAKKAEAQFRKVAALFPSGRVPVVEHSWEGLLKREGLTIEEKRELYHGQPAVKTFAAWKEAGFFDKIENYACGLTEYVSRGRQSALSTFAVVKDGEWYEKGSMGWWGMVSDEKDQAEWNRQFDTLIHDLSDDALLSIYDCHI